jgi:hypothetical protein
MRTGGQRVSFPHSPAAAQVKLSSVKLCLSLSNVDFFHILLLLLLLLKSSFILFILF